MLFKKHPHREPKSINLLKVKLVCPYNEAIIDENRIEQALRNATGVEDLYVQEISFEAVALLE
jgi:hypothetical protein